MRYSRALRGKRLVVPIVGVLTAAVLATGAGPVQATAPSMAGLSPSPSTSPEQPGEASTGPSTEPTPTTAPSDSPGAPSQPPSGAPSDGPTGSPSATPPASPPAADPADSAVDPVPTSRKTVAAADSLGAVRCGGYGAMPARNPVAQVMRDEFAVLHFAPRKVGNGQGDINWKSDPFQHISWRMWLHAMKWIGGLITSYEQTGNQAHLDRAAAIAADWVRDHSSMSRITATSNPAAYESTAHRLTVLICLGMHHQADWLTRAINDHAAYLAKPEHYSGPWNHGTSESIILMSAGCLTGNRPYADLAYRRLNDAVFNPPGANMKPAIDIEGANNEHSSGYSLHNRGLWQVAMNTMTDCNYPVSAELKRRHALMDEFIAHQISPNGRLVQIGESEAEKLTGMRGLGSGPLQYAANAGTTGSKPLARSRTYRAGYVGGRTGWGDGRRSFAGEMQYTGRFGPPPYAHGNQDHLGLTFFSRGRDILVDTGHFGYNNKEIRSWLKSPQAHSNLMVNGGVRFTSLSTTALSRSTFKPGADFFEVTDKAWVGTTRVRAVLAMSDPDLMFVLDRASSTAPRSISQLWHLPAGFATQRITSRTYAHAVSGDTRVYVAQVPLPGDVIPRGSTQSTIGKVNPRQGWVVPTMETALKAPVISTSRTGRSLRMLSVVAPTRRGGKLTYRVTREAGNWYRISGDIGGVRFLVRISPGGSLVRG